MTEAAPPCPCPCDGGCNPIRDSLHPDVPQVALAEQLEAAGCRMLAVHGRHCPPAHAHRQARLARCAADLDAVRPPLGPASRVPGSVRLLPQAAASPSTLLHTRMRRAAPPRTLSRPVARARPRYPSSASAACTPLLARLWGASVCTPLPGCLCLPVCPGAGRGGGAAHPRRLERQHGVPR